VRFLVLPVRLSEKDRAHSFLLLFRFFRRDRIVLEHMDRMFPCVFDRSLEIGVPLEHGGELDRRLSIRRRAQEKRHRLLCARLHQHRAAQSKHRIEHIPDGSGKRLGAANRMRHAFEFPAPEPTRPIGFPFDRARSIHGMHHPRMPFPAIAHAPPRQEHATFFLRLGLDEQLRERRMRRECRRIGKRNFDLARDHERAGAIAFVAKGEPAKLERLGGRDQDLDPALEPGIRAADLEASRFPRRRCLPGGTRLRWGRPHRSRNRESKGRSRRDPRPGRRPTS
jgi:hypothetical protein